MEVSLVNSILAIITIDKEKVGESSVPTFFCTDEDEREHTARLISKITGGMVHDLENGVYIIVKH